MNRLVAILIILAITSPLFFYAAEAQEPSLQVGGLEPTWKLTLSRSIIWIGEDVTAIINGTRNTTVRHRFMYDLSEAEDGLNVLPSSRQTAASSRCPTADGRGRRGQGRGPAW